MKVVAAAAAARVMEAAETGAMAQAAHQVVGLKVAAARWEVQLVERMAQSVTALAAVKVMVRKALVMEGAAEVEVEMGQDCKGEVPRAAA